MTNCRRAAATSATPEPGQSDEPGCGMACDVATLFCEDGREWADYLSECFRQQATDRTMVVRHELLDKLPLPLPLEKAKLFSAAKVTLLIVSPDFLDALEGRGAEFFALGRLLEADRGLAMLCGVETHELGPAVRAAFPTFSSWPVLEARNQDRDFVLSLVETTRGMLDRVEEAQRTSSIRTGTGTSSALFRLCPRKVHQGNTKVFAMMNQPVQQDQKLQLFLEHSGLQEVPVKWRNPFVLQFVVPDSFLQASKVINVQLRCDGALMGVRQLKCESQLSQLHALLQTVTSPYEMLCLTMGLATLHEADLALAQSFRRNLPPTGFHLLAPQQTATERKRSEEFLPTLLHFSAHYGLQELTAALLQCPGAVSCCHLLNCRGHSPAQLASNASHHQVATTITNFQTLAATDEPVPNQPPATKPAARGVETRSRSSPPQMHYENISPCHYASPGATRAAPVCNPSYGMTISLLEQPTQLPETEEQEAEYLSMMPFVESPRKEQSRRSSEDDATPLPTQPYPPEETSAENGSKITFGNTQEDLVKIIEMYKKGVPFGEIEKLFDDWRKNNETTKVLEENELQALRDVYKQKQRGTPNKQLFNFGDLRQIITGKGAKRTNRSRDLNLSQPDLLAQKQDNKDESCEGFRRVSTLSAVSTSSSASSSSSDRLSTMSSVSAYDSGTHSDSCEEGKLAPIPPPRPPKLPTPRQRGTAPALSTHQYYAFVVAPEEGGTTKSTLAKADATGNGSSSGIYYDIPQAPRPIVQHPNPMLDYDFPVAALRRATPAKCPPEFDNGKHYYDIPKWTCSAPKEVRLSVPDIPAPPVPDD